jgi:hypothetical protein
MHQIVRVSGILVIVMGVMMTNRGLKFTQPADASSPPSMHGYQRHQSEPPAIDSIST